MKNIVPDRPGEDDPGPGRRLGLDVGTVRIGVAVSDPDGILATPVSTVTRMTKRRGPDGEDIDSIVQLAHDYSVVEVIVGLPRMLDGSAGSSVKHAQDVGFRVRRRLERDGVDVPIRYVDERMTTVRVNPTSTTLVSVLKRGDRLLIRLRRLRSFRPG